MKEEADDAPPGIHNEYYKFGAVVVVVQCGLLRSPEVLTMDLVGMRAHIAMGREGVLPAPMKAGAPYVFFMLLGK